MKNILFFDFRFLLFDEPHQQFDVSFVRKFYTLDLNDQSMVGLARADLGRFDVPWPIFDTQGPARASFVNSIFLP